MTDLRRILRTLGWGVAGLLIIVFLIGYAAPYLPPTQFWWTDLVALLLPLAGVAVGLLGLGLFGEGVYRRKWGRVVIAGMLLGLVAIRFGPRFLGGNEPGSETETLRLMTFNLPPSLVKDSVSEATLERLIQREVPDVLALQESWLKTGPFPRSGLAGFSPSTRLLLEDPLGYAPPRVHPPQTTIYQPVVGRLVLDSMSVHRLPPTGDVNPRSRYTRTAFRWRGKSVVLYNVHLHTVGSRPRDVLDEWKSLDRWRAMFRRYREGALRRAEQARLLRRHIEQESRPVLIVGDFNSTPHQWVYRHVAQGLQEGDDWGAWSREATFPARSAVVRIDHILAGPAWDVTATYVPTVEGGERISDHRPLVARLRWRKDYEE